MAKAPPASHLPSWSTRGPWLGRWGPFSKKVMSGSWRRTCNLAGAAAGQRARFLTSWWSRWLERVFCHILCHTNHLPIYNCLAYLPPSHLREALRVVCCACGASTRRWRCALLFRLVGSLLLQSPITYALRPSCGLPAHVRVSGGSGEPAWAVIMPSTALHHVKPDCLQRNFSG